MLMMLIMASDTASQFNSEKLVINSVQLAGSNPNILPMDVSFVSVNNGCNIKVGMWAAQKKSDVEGISEEVEQDKTTRSLNSNNKA